ncbi:MAG: hypothetical protein QOE36_2556 [Gaiellaceae bacterium]|nr:hypothetical protein [Gaiellaceae bacterium]
MAEDGVKLALQSVDGLLAEDAAAAALVGLAFVAGRGIELDEATLASALRRALFVFAAGGDPHRDPDPDGPAIASLAGDLETPEARAELERGLGRLQAEAAGLPRVTAAAEALAADPDRAWRMYACALLADELAD